MHINRNNYEEYFLLYADNELSASDKIMVEDFVCQNPELEEELLIFKQSVIKPDEDCVLEDKGSLYKEPPFISHDNYQEILIMYTDNELNEREREQTETFLLQNANLGNELMLLQKTKLVPDSSIRFPGKQLLYKKEGKGKVVPIKWWRSVAAAIIAGIGLWLGISYLQNDKEKLPVAVENNPVKKINKIPPIPVDEKSGEPVKNIVAGNDRSKNLTSRKIIVNNTSRQPYLKKQTPQVDLVKKQKRPVILVVPPISDKSIENENESIAGRVELVKDKLIKKNDADDLVINESKNSDNVINKNGFPDNALPASYTTDEDENSNNYVFYNITKEEFNKTRLGGFLRKVKRTIERKSPFNNSKDDEEIPVKKHSKKL